MPVSKAWLWISFRHGLSKIWKEVLFYGGHEAVLLNNCHRDLIKSAISAIKKRRDI